MKKAISLLIAITLLCSLALPFASAEESGVKQTPMTMDEVLTNFTALDENMLKDSGSEYGYVIKKNSADLAWTVSYVLEAYSNMYEVTHDPKYLKKLGEQFRFATTFMRDTQGNGKMGWDTSKYALQKLADPAFDNEFAAVSEKTTNQWSPISKNAAPNVKIVPEGHKGNGLLITAKKDQVSGVKTYVTDYMKGYLYGVRIMAKTEGDAVAAVTLRNAKTGSIIPSADTGKDTEEISSANEWKFFEIQYKLPENGDPLVLSLESAKNSPDGKIFFDTVGFTQVAQFIVHDTLFAAPASKFVKFVRNDSALAASKFDDKTTYGELADNFLKILEPLVAKWDCDWRDVGNDMGVYYWPEDESGERGFVLPHNQYLQMVALMLPLYDVTGNKTYLDRATKLLRFYKSKLKEAKNEDGETYYYWNYMDRAFADAEARYEVPEDTSHGALDVAMAIKGYEYDIIFNEEDMKRMARSVRAMLWNGSVEKPLFYRWLQNDSKDEGRYKYEVNSENNIRDWLCLAKWDPELLDAFTTYLRTSGDPVMGHPSKLLAYSFAYELMKGNLKYDTTKFVDLAGYDWAKDAILGLASKGVINGITNDTFAPSKNITRADFVVLVIRSLGLKADVTNTFSDVSSSAYYAKEVGIAKSLGIINGTGNNQFNPHSEISRQDIMTILARAFSGNDLKNVDISILNSFSDSNNIADYAKSSIAFLVQNGTVNGVNGKINPQKSATRAEAAVILWRF